MKLEKQKYLDIIFSYVDGNITKEEYEKQIAPFVKNNAEKNANELKKKHERWLRSGYKISEEEAVEEIENFYKDNPHEK